MNPKFGSLQVTAIHRTQIRDFLAELSAKGELSRNTLRLILCRLRVVLNHAAEDGIIEQNPAAKLGKFTKTQKPKRQAEAMTRGEISAFLNATREFHPDYYPLFLMGIRAGLRKGELLAVKWGYPVRKWRGRRQPVHPRTTKLCPWKFHHPEEQEIAPGRSLARTPDCVATAARQTHARCFRYGQGLPCR